MISMTHLVVFVVVFLNNSFATRQMTCFSNPAFLNTCI